MKEWPSEVKGVNILFPFLSVFLWQLYGIFKSLAGQKVLFDLQHFQLKPHQTLRSPNLALY